MNPRGAADGRTTTNKTTRVRFILEAEETDIDSKEVLRNLRIPIIIFTSVLFTFIIAVLSMLVFL